MCGTQHAVAERGRRFIRSSRAAAHQERRDDGALGVAHESVVEELSVGEGGGSGRDAGHDVVGKERAGLVAVAAPLRVGAFAGGAVEVAASCAVGRGSQGNWMKSSSKAQAKTSSTAKIIKTVMNAAGIQPAAAERLEQAQGRSLSLNAAGEDRRRT